MTAPKDAAAVPKSVHVERVLGSGRAARAQLVLATFDDGRQIRCVEKLFSPGWLTRVIYRVSFQSPFAYQSNRDAILACFYRRRVAAAVIAASDTNASVAMPIYVRFDQPTRSWVLAATWIDGRGIRPAPVDTARVVRRRKSSGDGSQLDAPEIDAPEIDQIVQIMSELERLLVDCGMVGSGWQVSPRAIVSTANLLRTGQRYTIVDLESGIPAVLVPKYIVSAARCGSCPPFDELDAKRLRSWLRTNDRLLLFRLGSQRHRQLHNDAERLIEHSESWKAGELALLRRPWRLLRSNGFAEYQQECLRRWRQDGITGSSSDQQPSTIAQHAIWWTAWLPLGMGRVSGRLIGDQSLRAEAMLCLRSAAVRREKLRQRITNAQQQWIASERLPPSVRLSAITFVMHHVLQSIAPARLHRWLVDHQQRRASFLWCVLLICSGRYQSWYGQRMIVKAIDRWQSSDRISVHEAAQLRDDLRGHEVHAYLRGFGGHIALKAVSPVLAPAKVGGLAMFLSQGNVWGLLPMLILPLVRTLIAVASWRATSRDRVPHAAALATSWLPTFGLIAFPLQMVATRPRLSSFLIRDSASQLGRRIPIYGGSDSRTEIALIRATDYVIAAMKIVSAWSRRWTGEIDGEHLSAVIHIPITRRSRFGRWLDRETQRRIEAETQRHGCAADELTRIARAA